MTARRSIAPATAVAAAAAWIALVGNLPLWLRLQRLGMFDTALDWLQGVAVYLVVWASLAAVMALFGWRGVLKPAVAVFALIAAVAGHFMLTYGVVIDAGMITNTLQTDVHEATALLHWRLFAALAVVAAVPVLLLARVDIAYGPLRRQAAQAVVTVCVAVLVVVLAVFAVFRPLASLMRNHKDVRYLVNPLSTVYSLGNVALGAGQRVGVPPQPMGQDAQLLAQSGARPTLLLLVLGETARADKFSLNGYARNTNPALAAEGVVSFTDAWACGTSTAESVPCMFSHLAREDFKARKHDSEGLLDVLQRAGLAVLWLDNQSGCKGVCDRVPHATTQGAADARHCSAGECLDGVMLEGLDERIAALDPQRLQRGLVVVLHQMGSHGPAYYRRSPPSLKPFQPECRSAALDECTREAIENAFDNSIAYTDHFLGRAIGWLKGHAAVADTALLYVSDHGESLGENNIYLHGMPYLFAPDAQKHVPWITWVSDGYRTGKGLSPDCLRQRAGAHVTHDHYFHSVLGLMDVRTGLYEPGLDAYAPCRERAGARDAQAQPQGPRTTAPG